MASKILQITPHEAENKTEISLREAFELLQYQLKPPFPLTIPSQPEYLQLNKALLYGILTQPHFAKIHFTHLNAIVTDGYEFFVGLLFKIVMESYPKLIELSRVQLIWVTSKLVDVSGIGVENLLVSLLRQIVGGDFSDWNLWLSSELLRVFLDKWDWLLEEPVALTSAVFVYLRLLADHYRLAGSPKIEALKRMEIDFCVRVLREQFCLCLRIGKDLIRLLQDLVHIPEFRALWKDLLLNPVELGVPGFSDISQLYCSRTSSRYFLLRIMPEMETQLRFLLTHVRLGSQKRYQTWFARKFLCGSERETVICDIVRFICCAHHPPNEIIQSDIIPRWAVIGWLLTSCKKNYVVANAKLALFYDWLFFDEKVDNIMNIEPAILLMVNSIPKYIDITHTLLEYLFLLMDNYDVERKDLIVRGVATAFGILVKKGVVHSLETLTSCNVLFPLLKERLADIFTRLNSGVPKEAHPANLPRYSLPPPLSLPSPSNAEGRTSLLRELSVRKCARKNGFVTKSVDASVPLLDNTVVSQNREVITNKPQFDKIKKLVKNLGETIKQSNRMGLQTLQEILLSFANLVNCTLDTEDPSESVISAELLACQITEAFKLNGYRIFAPLQCPPNKLNCEDEIQSATALITHAFIFSQHKRMEEMILFWSKIGCPVGAHLLSYASQLAFEVHMTSCLRNSMDENDSAFVSDSDVPLLKCHIDGYALFTSGRKKNSPGILVSASKMDTKIVAKLVESSFAAYKRFLMLSSTNKPEPSLAKLLVSDLITICEWKMSGLQVLFSNIFSHLSDLSTDNEDLIRLLVERLNHKDVVAMQFDVRLKRFSIFGEDTEIISHLVKSSLNWGFVEQQKFWVFMMSELTVSKIQVEKVVLDFFSSGALDLDKHTIAAGGLLTLCSCCVPTPEFVGAIMSLHNNSFRDFAAAVLASWVLSNGSMLFNSLAKWLEEINKKSGGSVLVNSTEFRINRCTIVGLLNFLDTQKIKSLDCVNQVSVNISEMKAKLADAALLQEADDYSSSKR